DCIDDTFSDQVATDNAAEDVDQYRLDLAVGDDQLERLGYAFLGGAATDIKEVRRFAAMQLDDVHGRHGQSRTVDHTGDIAVQCDVIEIEALGVVFHLVFLRFIAEFFQFR